MQLNVIKTPDDKDFDHVKFLCDDDAGWTLKFDKKTVKVWTKACAESDFDMIRASVEYADVDGDTLYDVLHDGDYRPTWDKYMLDSAEVGLINPNNDICYYAREWHNSG